MKAGWLGGLVATGVLAVGSWAQAASMPALRTDVLANVWVCSEPAGVCPWQQEDEEIQSGPGQALAHATTLDDPPLSHPLQNTPISASASGSTSYGIHRGSAGASPGGLLTDDDLGLLSYTSAAALDSLWQDVWTFDADGIFTASMRIRGEATAPNALPGFEEVFDPRRDVFYLFTVGDLTLASLPPPCDPLDEGCEPCPETGCPVAEIQAPFPGVGLGAFNETVAIAFGYQTGHEYLVRSLLALRAENGAGLHFLDTAVLTDPSTSAGSLSAASGTDYASLGVPAPPVAPLLLGALPLLRRRSRPGGERRRRLRCARA